MAPKVRKFMIGINESIIGKSDPKQVNHATGWSNRNLTMDQLVKYIRQGFAFSAHFAEGYRKGENFLGSDVVAADVDGTITIAEAMEIPFVKDFAAFIYTTPSHKKDAPRFRIVFLLEDTITDARHWADALLGLAARLNSDPSIRDAARLFYGSLQARVRRISKLLPAHELEKLIALGADERVRKRKGNPVALMRSSLNMPPEETVVTATGATSLVKDLAQGTSVHCPYHLDKRPSAFIVKSSNGSTGIHCRACAGTFWVHSPEEYDFDQFDRLVAEREGMDASKLQKFDKSPPDNFFEQLFPPRPTVARYRQAFLPALLYKPGVTLVKSPKGSGKTAALAHLVRSVRDGEIERTISKKDRPKTVLLVGHRQALIREAATKLGLACYLDEFSAEQLRRGFAICLDSLHKITSPTTRDRIGRLANKPLSYDVVILDESEQVFSHLTAQTLVERGRTQETYNALETIILKAKAVYALDADLGLITAHALKQMRRKDWDEATRIIVNEPVEVAERRTMHLYESRSDLEQQLVDAINGKMQCVVVSNSKNMIDTLDKVIEKRCGAISRRKITSDNSQQEDERNFVLNIKERILETQVLLCSPSLGTGIDITFNGNEQKIDHVFGFFSPHINTHTDIDQQLARVRRPGQVSVFFEKRPFNYETSFEVIRDDLARARWVPSAIKGTDDNGLLDYDKEHPLLLISAHTVAAARSSKNNLVDLFVRLREANGWDVVTVYKREKPAAKSEWQPAKMELLHARNKGILAAGDRSDVEVIELHEAKREGKALSEQQRYELERGRLRMKFQSPVTEALIQLNSNGRLEERVKNFREAMYVIGNAHAGRLPFGLKLERTSPGQLIGVLMTYTGLTRDGRLNADAKITKTELIPFVQVCQKNRTVIEEISGIELGNGLKRNPIRILNSLLKQVGLRLVKFERKRRVREVVRSYALDGMGLGQMTELAEKFRDDDLPKLVEAAE